MSEKELSIAFQTDKSVGEYVTLAKLVDQFSFDVVSVYCDSPFHPSYGPLMVMAPHITRARLGPAAVSPFRIHPLDIAANTAMLAELAKGGVYVGVARGAWLAEHGINEPSKPIQGIREAINIIQSILSNKSPEGNGVIFRVGENVRAPYPLPAEPIPVLVGTWGKKLAKVAGEIADEVKIGGSANPKMCSYIKQFVSAGERISMRAEGEVKIVLGAVTVVDQDRMLAKAKAKMEVALYLPVVAGLDPTINIDPERIKRIQEYVHIRDFKQASEMIPEDILDLFAFSGTPEDVINQVLELFEAGVNRVEFGTPHGISAISGIKLLGEKVVSVLKKIN